MTQSVTHLATLERRIKLGLFTVLFDEKPLEEVCAYAASLGYETVELACWHGSNHFDLERAGDDASYRREVLETVRRHGLEISCISNHLDGQLVLGPLDRSTDSWAPTTDPDEKVKFGTERTKLAARVAAALEVPCVASFVGSHVWGHWYNHDPLMNQMYEEGWALFAERWNPILDVFKEEGVKYALEVHPVQIAYNIETSHRAIAALDGRPEFGFNFDPSHFVWQMIDPCQFVVEHGDRIFHAHAKDSELVKHNLARSGVVPTGDWQRPDRGFRFRCPGWGDVEWRRLITTLLEVGYDYVLSYEHEDPIMSREDGVEKCIEFLRPLVIKQRLESAPWW